MTQSASKRRPELRAPALAAAFSCVLSAGCTGAGGDLDPAARELAPAFNYAEALQKSLYFYEAQQSGPLPSWNRGLVMPLLLIFS